MDPAVLGEPRPFPLADFLGKEKPHFGIFITDVDISVGGLDHPSSDQHALDEPMRIAFEIKSILERAGLAFVGVDGEQPRRRFSADQRPFASGGKAGATEAAQSCIADDFDDLVVAAYGSET